MDAPRPLKKYDWPPKSLHRIFTTYPAQTILWTTMDPLVDHFYEWPLTKLNLWMAPDPQKIYEWPPKSFA